jgi:hypothetical protein
MPLGWCMSAAVVWPQVYGLLWSPFLAKDHFLSWGVNHLKLWTPGKSSQGAVTYSGITMRFGKASTHVVTAAVVLEGGLIVTVRRLPHYKEIV